MAISNQFQHPPSLLKQTNSFAIQIVYDSLKSKIAYPPSWQLRLSLHGGGGIHWVAFVCWEHQAEVPNLQPGVWAARWRMR